MAKFTYGDLFNVLKPDIIGLIDDVYNNKFDSGSAGSTATSDSGTTILDPSSYSDALLRDGSRTLLGNLSVASGKTIDGVDISELANTVTTHVISTDDIHPQYAGADGGTLITAAYQAERLTTGALARVNTWTGSQTFQADTYTGDLIPVLHVSSDVGKSNKYFRSGFISELNAEVFVENQTTLIGGEFLIVKGYGTLPTAMTNVQATFDFGQAMTLGDYIVLKSTSPLQTEYIAIGTLVGGTNYNIVRNVDGSGANAWSAETVYAIFGQKDDHRIAISADRAAIDIIKQGNNYNDADYVARLGNLNGTHGYVTDIYGFVAGDATGTNVTIDPTNGFRLRNGSTDVVILNGAIAQIESGLSFAGGQGLLDANGLLFEVETFDWGVGTINWKTGNTTRGNVGASFDGFNWSMILGGPGQAGIEVNSDWVTINGIPSILLHGDVSIGNLPTRTHSVTGNITCNQNLTVSGTTTLNGNNTIGNSSGDVHTFNGNTTFNNNLTVSGTATLNGSNTIGNSALDTHTLTGNTTFNNNLTVNGNTSLGNASTDTTTITGSTTISNGLTVSSGTMSFPTPTETSLTLANSWTNLTPESTWGGAHCSKDAFGYVKVSGVLTGGTITDGTTIATLPVGFRPSRRRIFGTTTTIAGTAYPIRLDIDTLGNILCYSIPAGAFIPLDNIMFHISHT